MSKNHWETQPRDKYGKFTTSYYNELSIEELKNIVTSKPGLVKIDLQFFTERDIYNQSSASLKRSIRKFIKKIKLHQDKINNPQKYIPDWEQKDPREQNGIIKWWNREIRNYTNSYNERVEELKKRGDYDDE